MKKTVGFLLLIAGSAQAAWFGDPGRRGETSGSSLEFFYESGDRDFEQDNSGGEAELSSHRLVIQCARGLGQGFEWVLRGAPATGRLSLSNSNFDPDVWSVGSGFLWSPPEPLGPVRVGISFTGDYQVGRESNGDTLHRGDMYLTGGVGWPLPRDFSLYGGAVYSKAALRFDTGPGHVSFRESTDTGGFVGGAWSPGTSWSVSTEAHFGFERVWGVSARYHFQ